MTDVRSKAIAALERADYQGDPERALATAKIAEVYARLYAADVEKAKRYV